MRPKFEVITIIATKYALNREVLRVGGLVIFRNEKLQLFSNHQSFCGNTKVTVPDTNGLVLLELLWFGIQHIYFSKNE